VDVDKVEVDKEEVDKMEVAKRDVDKVDIAKVSVEEIRKLKNKIKYMDSDLIRVRNERNKLKVECNDMKDDFWHLT
jgi:hypothetical protein